jgi:hypothetical protein
MRGCGATGRLGNLFRLLTLNPWPFQGVDTGTGLPVPLAHSTSTFAACPAPHSHTVSFHPHVFVCMFVPQRPRTQSWRLESDCPCLVLISDLCWGVWGTAGSANTRCHAGRMSHISGPCRCCALWPLHSGQETVRLYILCILSVYCVESLGGNNGSP